MTGTGVEGLAESQPSQEAGRQPALGRAPRTRSPGLEAWLYLLALSQDVLPPRVSISLTIKWV